MIFLHQEKKGSKTTDGKYSQTVNSFLVRVKTTDGKYSQTVNSFSVVVSENDNNKKIYITAVN